MFSSIFEEMSRFDGMSTAGLALLRIGAAAATALVVALVFGRRFVRFQKHRRILERAAKGDSLELDALHASKSRTPTMGGCIFLFATLVATLLWARLDSPFIWLAIVVAALLAALGFLDDLTKLRFAGRRGISARSKLLVQLLVGVGAGAVLYESTFAATEEVSRALFLPFSGGVLVPLGLGFVALCALAVAGTSNAVNLTDGLDGLAMGCAVIACLPLIVLALLAAHLGTAGVVAVPHVSGAEEIAVGLGALGGGGLGFLWFNSHPARIFMGDTGALPLGGLLGLCAVMLKQEFCFVILGGVFLAEALSVMLQVGSFKLRGKRIFRIAPLHHHFQFLGWPETRVTQRFWIAAALLSVVSLATLKFL